MFGLDGKFVREIELPGIGSAGGFPGKRADTETFYSFTSFTTPGIIYRLNLSTGMSAEFRAPTLKFNPADYVTQQVFYISKDGTSVPMFITHKHGLKLDGQRPTLLYGYGGFNISLTPAFSVGNLAWMEMGGVLAVANIRGGGGSRMSSTISSRRQNGCASTATRIRRSWPLRAAATAACWWVRV